MINQPTDATITVLTSVVIDVFNDFCTNCLIKKSDSPAIEINARAGTFEIFSSPSPYFLITMTNAINPMASRQ